MQTNQENKRIPTEEEVEAVFQKVCASLQAFFNIKEFDGRFKISDRMGIAARDDIYFSQAIKELAVELSVEIDKVTPKV